MNNGIARRALLLVAALSLGMLAAPAGAQCTYADYLASLPRDDGDNIAARSSTGLCGHNTAWTSAVEDAECGPVQMMAAATNPKGAGRVETAASAIAPKAKR